MKYLVYYVVEKTKIGNIRIYITLPLSKASLAVASEGTLICVGVSAEVANMRITQHNLAMELMDSVALS